MGLGRSLDYLNTARSPGGVFVEEIQMQISS